MPFHTKRGVAQPGSAHVWGACGRRFKSGHPEFFLLVTMSQHERMITNSNGLENSYVLLSEEIIKARISSLAEEINSYYQNLQDVSISKPVHIIGILKGSILFLADLIRKLNFPLSLHFIELSSYQNNLSSTGSITIHCSPKIEMADQHILIVEDIIDSGLTLNFLWKRIQQERPATLEIAALLCKTEKMCFLYPNRFQGFAIPDEYVFGFGMDYKGLYRQMPDILAVKKHT